MTSLFSVKNLSITTFQQKKSSITIYIKLQVVANNYIFYGDNLSITTFLREKSDR